MVIRKWLFDHNSPSAGAGRPDETVWRVPPYKQMRHGTDIKKKKRSGGIFRLRLAYRFVKLGVVNKHCVLPNYTAPEVMFIQPFLRQINCLESAESHRAD